MRKKAAYAYHQLLNHYLLICLFFALIVLTLVGVGNVILVSLLGVLLSLVGVMQGRTNVDLWILLPLLVYNVFSWISSYRTFGNPVEGFVSLQLIFPVIYLLSAYLSPHEQLRLRKLCVVWVGVVAVLGIMQFLYGAVVMGSAKRLGGLLGNPNGMGIYLVLGWYAWLGFEGRFLSRLEPFLLIALGLTLSMGSFAAMAVGIVTLLALKKRQHSWFDTFSYCRVLLARISLGVAIGFLLYVGAARTNASWICLFIAAYALYAAWCWQRFATFLQERNKIAFLLAMLGILVAAGAVIMRPSAAATFGERLAMIKNGIGYLGMNPLFGVGPYQWRVLNLADGDIYFNTNHIHNIFVHVGVELGWIAMAMLILIVVRCFWKRKDFALLPACVAFLFHSMIDTGFFYLGIVALLLFTVGEPCRGGSALSFIGAKVLFSLLALVFLGNLWWYLRMI